MALQVYNEAVAYSSELITDLKNYSACQSIARHSCRIRLQTRRDCPTQSLRIYSMIPALSAKYALFSINVCLVSFGSLKKISS